MFPLTIEGSWAHLLPWGPMDLVVSNPPYIFHQDMEQLAPEIRRCSMWWEGGRPERAWWDVSALGDCTTGRYREGEGTERGSDVEREAHSGAHRPTWFSFCLPTEGHWLITEPL